MKIKHTTHKRRYGRAAILVAVFLMLATLFMALPASAADFSWTKDKVPVHYGTNLTDPDGNAITASFTVASSTNPFGFTRTAANATHTMHDYRAINPNSPLGLNGVRDIDFVECFCIEPGASIHGSGSYSGAVYTSGNPENMAEHYYNQLGKLTLINDGYDGAALQQMLDLALHFGYPNGRDSVTTSEQANAYYAATQLIVWQCMYGWRTDASYTINDRSVGYGGHSGTMTEQYTANRWVNQYYTEILSDMANWQKKPSFAGGSYTMNWSGTNNRYEVTLTDTNGVLSGYSMNTVGSGVYSSKSGNTVTFWTTSQISGSASASFTKSLPQTDNFFAWTASDASQQMISGAGNASESAQITLRTGEEPTGDLKLKKTSDDGKVSGIGFKLYGPFSAKQTSFSGDKYLTQRSTDGSGYLQVPDLQPGWYWVQEMDTGDSRYQIPAPQCVQVSAGKTAEVSFHNTVKPAKLHLKKTCDDASNVNYKIFDIYGPYSSRSSSIDRSKNVRSAGTDESGNFTVDLTAYGAGWYWVEEQDGDNGRYEIPAPQCVYVTYGKTAEVTFHNRRTPLPLKLQKSSTDGRIAGIEFLLYGPFSDGEKNDPGTKEQLGTYYMPLAKQKTDKSGKIEWDLSQLGGKDGWYYVEENLSSAEREKYEAEDGKWVYVNYGETTTVRFQNNRKRSLRVVKGWLDGNLYGQSVSFTLTGIEGDAKKENYEETREYDERTGEAAVFENLPAGLYALTENVSDQREENKIPAWTGAALLTPGSGNTVSGWTVYVAVGADGEYLYETPEGQTVRGGLEDRYLPDDGVIQLECANRLVPPEEIDFQVYKFTDDGILGSGNLVGFTFRLYTHSGDLVPDGRYDETAVTDETGTASFTGALNFEGESFVLEEVSAPSGYVKHSPISFTLSRDYGDGEWSVDGLFYRGSPNGGNWMGETEDEIGFWTEMGVSYMDGRDPLTGKDAVHAMEGKLFYFETGNKWYDEYNGVWHYPTPCVGVVLYDPPETQNLEVYKFTDDGKTLSGFTFRLRSLKYEAGAAVPDGKYDETEITDETGVARFLEVPSGRYRLEELPADGYKAHAPVEFTVSDDGDVYGPGFFPQGGSWNGEDAGVWEGFYYQNAWGEEFYGLDAVREAEGKLFLVRGYGEDPPISAGIIIHNEPEPGNMRIVKTSDDGLVSGIEFAVYGPYPSMQTEIDRSVFCGTWQTDSDGTISIPDLARGFYWVEEIEDDFTAGYVIPVPQCIEVKPGETAEVHFHNKLPLGSITVLKTRGDTGAPAAGAEFLLEWSEDGILWQEQGRQITGDDGYARFEELDTSLYYRLTETKAAAGMQLLAEPVFEGKLSSDNPDVTFEVVNSPTFTLPPTGKGGFAPLLPAMLAVPMLGTTVFFFHRRKKKSAGKEKRRIAAE